MRISLDTTDKNMCYVIWKNYILKIVKKIWFLIYLIL